MLREFKIMFSMPSRVANERNVYYKLRALFYKKRHLTLADVEKMFKNYNYYVNDSIPNINHNLIGWTSWDDINMLSNRDYSFYKIFYFYATDPKELFDELGIKDTSKILNKQKNDYLLEFQYLQNQLEDILKRIEKVTKQLNKLKGE